MKELFQLGLFNLQLFKTSFYTIFTIRLYLHQTSKSALDISKCWGFCRNRFTWDCLVKKKNKVGLDIETMFFIIETKQRKSKECYLENKFCWKTFYNLSYIRIIPCYFCYETEFVVTNVQFNEKNECTIASYCIFLLFHHLQRYYNKE